MTQRLLLPVAAFACLVPLGAFAQAEGGGSAVPCDAPLAWHVAEVDDRFGLTREEAEDAVRLAGMLWEDAAARVLFPRDARRGFPIRFIWDERQEQSMERARRDGELEESARRIQEDRARVQELHRELEVDRERLERRRRTYEERQEAHRRAVEHWDRQGGAPEEERRRLRAESEALERERAALGREARGINEAVSRANRATQELNRRVDEHNRARARIQARFPREVVQSGTFRESRRTLGSRIVSVDREIRIHHFDDRDHLVLVLAHELGHALGLGHTGVPGSVMVDASGPGTREGAGPRLMPSDLELLRSRCPELLP